MGLYWLFCSKKILRFHPSLCRTPGVHASSSLRFFGRRASEVQMLLYLFFQKVIEKSEAFLLSTVEAGESVEESKGGKEV